VKTPEQTARDFIGADALAGVGYERDLNIATEAIAYDRRQTGPAANRPEDVAQLTLDAHHIRDDWNRNGAQVRDLIAEAIIRDRRSRLAALVGDLDVVRHHIDNTYEAAEGDSNDAEIALLQEVRDLYERLVVEVGGPWRDQWSGDVYSPGHPAYSSTTPEPLTDEQIAAQAAGGIRAHWIRNEYSADEAQSIADEAKAAALRALQIRAGVTA
jgi:hypothetical protein